MLWRMPSASTLWLYVRLQAMVLVGGIVGPIFLVTYFASQPDPTLKWMYYAGLIVTAGDILVALFLTAKHMKTRDATMAPRD
jgi:ABC-type multidrug transport system permease subunit